MAQNITVQMKDGSIKRFPHVGRPGGSYTKTVKYEGAFAIITDEHGGQTAIPAADIAEINTEPLGGGW